MNYSFSKVNNAMFMSKLRRCFTTVRCWQLDGYSSHENLLLKEQNLASTKLRMDEVLIKVKAASLNPIDVMMCKGFGKTLLNPIRSINQQNEFPFIPGRDCSGDVISVGKSVHRFKENDKIWCARWPSNNGTHSEHIIAKQSEIGLMPNNLDYVESSSIPYAASTAWNSLILSCNLNKNGRGKKILILAGSGGVGTLATQLAKSFKAIVTVTCSGSSFEMMTKLGADNCVNYKNNDYISELTKHQPFDAILDCSSSTERDIFTNLLSSSPLSKFINLSPPFFTETDDKGPIIGLATSLQELACGNVNQIYAGKGRYIWGRFNSNSGVLNELKSLVENAELVPVIDKVFKFEDAIDAFNYIASGRAKGKVVLEL